MADAYEREHMPGVGAILLRRKVTSPKVLMALGAGIPGAIGLIGATVLAATGHGLAALAALAGASTLTALLAFIQVTFATARLAVSEGEIHLQLGTAGPKIPISEIASVKLAPSGVNRVGMGVGKDLRGTTTFRMWGDNTRAVHIERKDGTRVVMVLKEPEVVAEAIQEAMRRAGHDGPKVRVAGPEDDAEIEQSDSEQRARRDEHQW